MLCNYGCGQESKFQLGNGKWCCSKSQNSCPMIKEKLSKTKLGDQNPMKRENSRRKSSDSHKGQIAWNKDLTKEIDPRVKKYTEKMAITKTGKKIGPHSKEWSERISRKIIEKWKDVLYQKRQMLSKNIKPNKPESIIFNILSRLYPNEWKYTGDYSFWINGKNPDFTCINGKKLLIEHFGTYWHEGDDPEERKKIFAKFGYKTLVIWEDELKDIEKLKILIKNFCKEDR